MRCRTARNASPGRATTLSSSECVIRKWLISGSGWACTSRSKVSLPQETVPGTAFFFTIFLRLAGSLVALAAIRSFSMTCSGACTTTVPEVSKPARPARPATWWNSRADSSRTLRPSYLVSDTISTVRIGTLMPTPRVSVPQTTASRPRWVSRSTRRRYRGSMPAWWTPTPAATSRDSVLPNPVPKRNAPTSARMASFCSLVRTVPLMRLEAWSSASFWLGCTT